MAEIYKVTTKENHRFQDLFHYVIWPVLHQQDQPDLLHGIVSGWSDCVISRELPILHFIKRPILKISPPYRSKDVHLLNPKFRDLADTYKEEIKKFWIIGRPYDFNHDNELEGNVNTAKDVHVRDIVELPQESDELVREIDRREDETLDQRTSRLFGLWERMENERMEDFMEDCDN